MSYQLDCESIASTLASLRTAFRCTTTDLEAFLRDPKYSKTFEANWEDLPSFDKFLYAKARGVLGRPELPETICWFHGNRVAPGTTFNSGIQPLGAWRAQLESLIISELKNPAAERQVRLALQGGGPRSEMLALKLGHPIHWGPFGILVQEVAAYANELGQHDYLKMPEVIEDLCAAVKANSGMDLLPIFESNWRPVMVKFSSAPTGTGERALRTALCYARSKIRDGKPCGNSIRGFDGHNIPVPGDNILSVTWRDTKPPGQ